MIYLDNAATSKYKPQAVIKAMTQNLEDSCNYSRGSYNEALNKSLEIEHIRNFIKKSLNAQSYHELIFTPSCTDGLNQIIFGLLSNIQNAHVIITTFEHNAVLRPLYMLVKNNNLQITVLRPERTKYIEPNQIEREIKDNTKLIITTHMSNVTGTITNIDRIGIIAKKYSIPYLVDVAQSIGHLKIDLKNIDFISAPAHKSLHGPQGIGFIIANKNYPLLHTRFGGSGINGESIYQPDIYPDGYEVGTQNTPGIFGLYEGFKFTYNNFNKINEQILFLSNILYSEIKKLDNIIIYSEKNSPIISIVHKSKDASDLANILNQNNIAIRSGLHCAPLTHKYLKTSTSGLVRMSIGLNNTDKDIKNVLNLLHRLNRIY